MLMVQSKPQGPAKSGKLKPPPPVPPRPNQNVVAEALAKTRKAVAESKLTKTRPTTKDEQKSKTLERMSTGPSPPNVSPKLNGLARVKSFIRDVISDRGSSDDKKSAGANSRRSSTESSSIPTPVTPKNAPEHKSSSKTMKSCRQALVRSLSTSTKLEQDIKSRALKSSGSFAEKTMPLRKAPPPPLSPKPKLREVKPVSLPKRNSLEIVPKPKAPLERPPQTPPKSPLKSPPVVIPQLPEFPIPEAPYATVDEVTDFDNRLSSPPDKEASPASATPNGIAEPRRSKSPSPKYTSSLERKTSRVTERLISEIIASKNKPLDSNTVIDKGKVDAHGFPNGGIEHPEGEKIPKDMNNHEMLIYELQTMRSQSHIPKAGSEENAGDSPPTEEDKCSSGRSSRAPSVDPSDISECSEPTDPHTCDDDPLKSRLRKQFRAISSMSLLGLPPLPKSLSGFAEGPLGPDDVDSPPSTPTDEAPRPLDMDSQLALLKREMASLRRLDLSLLSELWSLNEAMASWRQQLERAPAPRLRPAPPPPPPPHYLRT